MTQPLPSPPPSTPANAAQVRPNYLVLLEVLLLSGTGAVLTMKWLRGALDFYIHPRYTGLVLLAALMLFLMGGVRLRDLFTPQPAQRLSGLHLLLALPLLLGLLVPARPLGAETLAGRGLDLTNVPLSTQPATGDPVEWNLVQWATALTVQSDELQGEAVDVVGFVFHDERMNRDAFYAARYVVTCCAADAAAAGLPVLWEGGAGLPTDTWVRVQGTLDLVMLNGTRVPAIAATSVEPVDQPEFPYLFP
jgi:uncharacterized repeat protein (TIGR03943 family)